jgi:hypothetical protein
MVCSAASVAASMMHFSKRRSIRSLSDASATIGGSKFWKKSKALSWNLFFWLFQRMKLLVLILGRGSSSFSSFFLLNKTPLGS